MIVSLLYKVTWKLLCIPSVLLRREAVKDAELLVLRHQNTVLRRQLAGPVRYEPADRFWFAALSSRPRRAPGLAAEEPYEGLGPAHANEVLSRAPSPHGASLSSSRIA